MSRPRSTVFAVQPNWRGTFEVCKYVGVRSRGTVVKVCTTREQAEAYVAEQRAKLAQQVKPLRHTWAGGNVCTRCGLRRIKGEPGQVVYEMPGDKWPWYEAGPCEPQEVVK